MGQKLVSDGGHQQPCHTLPAHNAHERIQVCTLVRHSNPEALRGPAMTSCAEGGDIESAFLPGLVVLLGPFAVTVEA